MLNQTIEPWMDPCPFAQKWQISLKLARALVSMANNLPFSIAMHSGFRTAERQAELEEEGRPTASEETSTHRTCPATGADLTVSIWVTNAVKLELGHAAVLAGLRWGGGSRLVEVIHGIGLPLDWNHVDLGRRSG